MLLPGIDFLSDGISKMGVSVDEWGKDEAAIQIGSRLGRIALSYLIDRSITKYQISLDYLQILPPRSS
ncbi:hypothetical protein AKJ45_03680 [candidate division MSBL1 archaeon SCGC-AAA261F19]|uniref:Uncharacterized protein n=1 Tax=candidate division MSBL1 archaeon SCGC-AAA261F19 TaxID=1698275 RepID=A0A133V6S8_9EURY|nr:hypothetical protein AKJ45_03680 [candidate division MSBL1 archaeon SCGC-AAA261F19]